MNQTRPALLTPRFETMSAELTRCAQWLVWRAVWQPSKGKYNKIPIDAKTGGAGSSTNPAAWCDFETARAAYEADPRKYAGVGFALSPSDAFAGVDLDHVIHDKEVSGDARVVLDGLRSYTEVSPSGTGVRVFLFANVPPGGNKKGDVEMYDDGRFLTVTGRRLSDWPAIVEARQSELETLHAQTFPPPPPKPERANRDAAAVPQSDTDLLALAVGAKNGAKIAALYAGDWQGAGFSSQSDADMSLCSLLAFYTGLDTARLDGMFRASGLMRDKWDKVRYGNGDTYGARTVQKAIEGCTTFYTGKKSLQEKQAERATLRKETAEAVKSAAGFPVVETNGRHLRDMSDAARDALLAANTPPTLFVRGGKLARISLDEAKRATVTPLEIDMLTHRLARCVNFVSTSDDRGTVACIPPQSIVRDILAAPSWPGVPPLLGLVTSPVMAPDGTVCDAPGYQPKTGLFYHEAERLPVGDTSPTPENIKAALDLLLNQLLGDFPFVDAASRANALALLVLPFARQLVDGKTPFHLIDAPAAGTGKSLLAEVITEIFQPGGAEKMQASVGRDGFSDNDEWRKRITVELQKGSPFLFVDNITGVLSSPALDLLLTTGRWSDRVLGQTKDVSFPVRCVFIGTANNAELGPDMTRRSVWIRLDSKEENPDERDGFKIADLHAFVRRERPRLVLAVLTLLRAWVAKGRPDWSGAPIGTFENWSKTLGGILEAVGVDSFMANRAAMKTRLNPEREQWAAFFAAWYETHESAAVGVAEVAVLAAAEGIISDAEKGKKSLGRLLTGKRDTVKGGFRLIGSERQKKGAAQFCLTKEEETGGFGGFGGFTPYPNKQSENTNNSTYTLHTDTNKETIYTECAETAQSPQSRNTKFSVSELTERARTRFPDLAENITTSGGLVWIVFGGRQVGHFDDATGKFRCAASIPSEERARLVAAGVLNAAPAGGAA